MPASVVKRNGSREPVSFDQILRRVEEQKANLKVDSVRVAKTVVQGLRDGITTTELDELTVETAASLAVQHPDYSFLAAKVAISNLHKMTLPSIRSVYGHLSHDVLCFAKLHEAELDAALQFQEDYKYDIFGFKTLERAYLLRDEHGNVVERPQVMLMRIALGIHCGDLRSVLETYSLMSQRKFTHATPTMYNAGTEHPTLASCFLLPVMDDSIPGIFQTLERCAKISKSAGGIGLSFSNVRSSGSRISSTGGKSAGLLPFLRVYDATARAVDQGGGKRKGAFAIYLEPWHMDVMVFLDLKKHHGAEELRARDLFYAMWIPDLFMKRVEAGEPWTLLCPSQCHDLVDLYGDEFEAKYAEYEGRPDVSKTTMPARDVWTAILDSQIETGTPYMLYKDSANRKSNQKNVGTIRSSNLCTEIMEVSTAEEVAVCNLASLSLPAFVVESDDAMMHDDDDVGGSPPPRMVFDHEGLAKVVRVVTRNLNRVIDVNRYPLPEAETSNLRHRPIGIGVQGLADVFFLMDEPFDGTGARVLNRDIFETIYHAALTESCALAEEQGAYSTYVNSPAWHGKLQFDLWQDHGKVDVDELLADSRWDWHWLRERIRKHGLRNSLLVAPMPTASTAQILGNTECFEPITSNIYVRRVLAGEFAVFNRHLVRTLEQLGIWNDDVRTSIIAHNGSVQQVDGIPDHVKRVFKTAWEISQRTIIDLSADRAPFVDQSQSLNLFLAEASHAKLSSMHFYSWRKGLKTGMYYLRSKPAVNAVQVTVPVEAMAAHAEPCEACSA